LQLVTKKNLQKRRPQGADSRVERSKQEVLAATHELLVQSGLSGVSVDEVSRRSGVAKTTIYRHWPSRTALLLEACRRLSARPKAPDTGSLKGDLEVLAVTIANRLRQPWSTVLPSIIDAGERDKEVAQLHSKIHAEMRNAFVVVLERGLRRGDIPEGEYPSEIITAILGPLFYRRWFSREPLDENFARRVVTRALRSLR
jgi:AcrR family transcriptional regulator